MSNPLGSLLVSTDNLDSGKKFEALPLTLHLTFPGHHLATTFVRNSDFPEFLVFGNAISFWQLPGSPPTFEVHREGWASYAESLGHDLDLFKEDPVSVFGLYSMKMTRAARAVVDVGLNFYGWSRQKSLNFLMNNTALTLAVCEQEVDRYLTLPGMSFWAFLPLFFMIYFVLSNNLTNRINRAF